MKRITIKKIHNKLLEIERKIIVFLYKLSIPYKAKRIRKKERIKILFVLAELGSWKTENLYNAMLGHPRFEPVLGVTQSPESPKEKTILNKYLDSKNYCYSDLDKNYNLDEISPDIIIYQKPYGVTYLPGIRFIDNLDCLFCYTNYYFFNTKEPEIFKRGTLFKLAWQVYVENESVKKEMMELTGCKDNVILPTGIPMADNLILRRSKESDPWKKCGNKKRIIYAPHHSIGNQHTGSIDFGTIDLYGDFILSMAIKYKDSIQVAFKPHPVLYSKLVREWGQKRTDDYYEKWRNGDNTQFEDGEYVSLFQFSDAMIHDCNSFSIEYMYINKPALYLVRNENHLKNISEVGTKCFNAHYHGCCEEDIEVFIKNIISGIDFMQSQRNHLYDCYLKPTGNQSACQNIIDSICGKNKV